MPLINDPEFSFLYEHFEISCFELIWNYMPFRQTCPIANVKKKSKQTNTPPKKKQKQNKNKKQNTKKKKKKKKNKSTFICLKIIN